jgi:hypothetical protein
MPDDAGRDAAFYDHENEPRRHVADWGGDELFTRMPRRRAVHTPPPPRFRRPAPIDPVHRAGIDATGRFRGDGDGRGLDIGPAADDFDATEPWDGERDASARRRFDRREDAGPGAGRFSAEPLAGTDFDHRDATPGPRRTGRFAGADTADGLVSRSSDRDGGRTVSRAAWNDTAASDVRASSVSQSRSRADAPTGRRTVVIAGRPDGMPRAPRDRRRPPRTVAERIGPRPERIVAWAFALGLLLILIAVATADAATI